MSTELIGWIIFATRVVAAGIFFLALLVALTHWAVRAGKLQPFGAWPRFVRGWSDRLLHPIEGQIVRRGGNPQDASFWLLGIAVALGLGLIAVVQWILEMVLQVMSVPDASPRYLLILAVHYLFRILIAALFIRVIASWINVSPYNRFMRIVYGLTSWLIDPIRRLLPAMGPLDFSPLVAYFLLYLAERTLMGLMV